MRPEVRQSLSPDQLAEVRRALDAAIPRPAPRIVDLRFVVDLLVARYHVVVMLGRDRRGKPRSHRPAPGTRIANWIVGVLLLLSINLALSLMLFLLAYLVKTILGLDLLPGHFGGR